MVPEFRALTVIVLAVFMGLEAGDTCVEDKTLVVPVSSTFVATPVYSPVWRSCSRPGCQSPHRKYARYLSTTFQEVEDVRQQEQQGDKRDDEEGDEVKGGVEEIRSNAHYMQGRLWDEQRLKLEPKCACIKQGRQWKDNDTNWQQKERLRKRKIFNAWWLMHGHQLRSQIHQVFQVAFTHCWDFRSVLRVVSSIIVAVPIYSISDLYSNSL